MTSTLTSEQWLTAWRHWHTAREAAVLAPHDIAACTGTTWLSADPQVISGLPGEWAVRDGDVADVQQNLAFAPGKEHYSGDKLIR